MKVKVIKFKFLPIPKELEKEVNEILADRNCMAVRDMPENAKYHVGGEQADLVHLIGGVPYYEKRSKEVSQEKIPVEYLRITDEFYNELKEKKIDEVSRNWFYNDVDFRDKNEKEEDFYIIDKRDEMLSTALEFLECYDKLYELGVIGLDEIDLDKDIVKQIVDIRGIDAILDIEVSRLPVSMDLIRALWKEKCENIGDIIKLSEDDILKSQQFNSKLRKELKDILSKLNLNLKANEHTL